MPRYEYLCPSCGVGVQLQVPIDERDDQQCDRCGAHLERQISRLRAVVIK